MVIKILLALLFAFAFSAGFGKWYVPWLKKCGAKQPLKDEVAAIYAETAPASNGCDNELCEKNTGAENTSKN